MVLVFVMGFCVLLVLVRVVVRVIALGRFIVRVLVRVIVSGYGHCWYSW